VRREARTIALLIEARRQARFPFRSPAAIARARRRQVQSMVRHAFATVPFYRQAIERLGASPRDFVDVSDLARLPILERADLQLAPETVRSSAYGPADGMVLRSSGSSTGAPRRILHDQRAILLNAAHGERERSIVTRIVGRATGYREAVFTMLHSTTMEVQEHLQNRLRLPGRFAVQRAYFPLDDPLDENVRRLAEFRPQVVQGYGSHIGCLLRRAAELGRVPPELRVVSYSSDGMSEPDRRFITEQLGIPVLCTYQAVEAFKIGFECGESQGLHVNDDLYPIRIVDQEGRDAPAGESGAVIVSNLVNRATVLLNYRIGDRAALLPGRCPCGRALPRMTLPLGREGEWIALLDGGRLHVQVLHSLFRGEDRVLGFQIEQQSVDRLRISLVGAPAVERSAVEQRLRRRLVERLGQVAVEFEWVAALERTADGKVRIVAARDRGPDRATPSATLDR
jgi:phenylacetate-CoA ligase